ncbi:ABC transporter substrate-binding protein [Streptomyces sp. TRM76323]|uniref:ABC transporter substrate-binding protein n=1 Tax=Streptomyces tamarix TaxID=3078565 RepID=A0ABU3QD43_9ACTN|nr:ABC transporter substrate-binding protein [Streptomyces tamarix]MDT9680688.1 ABC transporter substrate-binding protein [Streptomyces tamarix]
MTGRRSTYAVVALCLALLVTGAVAGAEWWAGRWKGSVTVLGNWTGEDEERFRRDVLGPFERKHRIRVVYQGSSAESQVLAADVASGTPPDVVIMPGPGELAAYAAQGRLKPLDGLFDPDHYDPVWAPALKGGVHWVPVKVDLKSMVWHPGALTEAEAARIARDPGEWCLAMESGATSGWPGTDWVEDVLLQQAGWETYQKWATGRLPWTDPAVRRAWTTWGDLVGAGDRRRVERALLAPYQDPWGGGRPACVNERLEHQAAFVRAGAHWTEARGRYVHSKAVIPGARPDLTAWEVSGDLAAMLRDTPGARALIRHLADPGTARLGFTANRSVPSGVYDADPMAARIDATLRGRGTMRCWDASDAMPPAMRDAFHQAVLRFLADPRELPARLAVLEEVRERHGKAEWLPSACGSG